MGTRDPGFTTTELADYRATRRIVVSSEEAQSTEAPNDKQPHVPAL